MSKTEITTTENFNDVKTKNKKTMYKAKCYHCKDKDTVTADNGVSIDLPYKLVDIPKNKELLAECKKLAQESKDKYGDSKVAQRQIINGCPKCGKDIIISCQDYVDFYSPKKQK